MIAQMQRFSCNHPEKQYLLHTYNEVVYENVEMLSETLELESVFELDDITVINSGMVNRPISESEVLM